MLAYAATKRGYLYLQTLITMDTSSRDTQRNILYNPKILP